MRKELEFPQIDERKLELVKTLIDNIAEKIGDCSKELNRLHCLTGKEHTALDFAEYWGWINLDMLARITLTPEPPYIENLSKTEIEEIIMIIKDCMIMGMDDKEEYYVELLHKSLPLTDVRHHVMSGNDEEKIADDMINAAISSVIAL